jgi:hypothetical protein
MALDAGLEQPPTEAEQKPAAPEGRTQSTTWSRCELAPVEHVRERLTCRVATSASGGSGHEVSPRA